MTAVSAPVVTPATHPTVRRRILALLSLVLLAVAAAACMPNEERTFLDRTNALRSSRGVPQLAENDVLTAKAEAWAVHMASTGVLAHSNLSQGLDGLGWRSLGENVGMRTPTSDTLLSLYNDFAGSAVHLQNMLSTQFNHMGVGVATSPDGRVWVAEVFAGL